MSTNPASRILILESAFGRQLAEITVQAHSRIWCLRRIVARWRQLLRRGTVGLGCRHRASDSHASIRPETTEWCNPIALSPDGKWLARGDTASITWAKSRPERKADGARPRRNSCLAGIHPFDGVVATSATDGRNSFVDSRLEAGYYVNEFTGIRDQVPAIFE